MKKCNMNEEERFKYSLSFSLFFLKFFFLNIFQVGYGGVKRAVFSLTCVAALQICYLSFHDFLSVNIFAFLELQIRILSWFTCLDMHAKPEIAN